MRTFLLLFLALALPLNVFAGNGSGNVSSVLSIVREAQQPTLVIPESNPSSYFQIWCGGGSGTSGNSWPCRKNGTVYQVPSGKTARCVSIRYAINGAGSTFQLVSGTAAFTDNTVPTGPVYQASTSANVFFSSVTANVAVTESILYDFAALTYPGINLGSNSVFQVALTCKEI